MFAFHLNTNCTDGFHKWRKYFNHEGYLRVKNYYVLAEVI